MSDLAERLRRETHTLHRAAERSRFMATLLRGRMDRHSYCALLRNLHAIYAVLEPALVRHARDPWIAPVFLPSLWRSAALADDLHALHGASWADAYALEPATLRYRERLSALDTGEQPGLLLAHAYVRYLGDLNGGQSLRRAVTDSLQLEHGIGTAFYDFGSGADTLALTQAFRSGLDALIVDVATADALVGEAVLAFELHGRLFEELARERGVTGDPRSALTDG
jgi:heme oxygenase (biliverdin-producing, ferredoxin)